MSKITLESQLFDIIKDKEMAENIKCAKIDMLVRLGVDVNAMYGAKSALMLAKEVKEEKVAEFLGNNGGKNIFDEKEAKELGMELIEECDCEEVNEEKVKELIGKGADIAAKDEYAETSLIKASRKGYSSVVKLLLEKGADIEAKNNDGRTSLILASENGHSEIVKMLLEKGANIEVMDEYKITSLIMASKEGNSKVVKLLLEKGADIEAKSSCGETSLMWASHRGHGVVVKLLLEKGANVDAKSLSGKTALDWADSDKIKKMLNEAKNKNSFFYKVKKGFGIGD